MHCPLLPAPFSACCTLSWSLFRNLKKITLKPSEPFNIVRFSANHCTRLWATALLIAPIPHLPQLNLHLKSTGSLTKLSILMSLYQHTCPWLCVGHLISVGVSSGSCRQSAPSTSCLAFACCCCSSRCSGCSSAVRGMCPPHARTAASPSSRHAQPTPRRQRQRTTLRGVLTS